MVNANTSSCLIHCQSFIHLYLGKQMLLYFNRLQQTRQGHLAYIFNIFLNKNCTSNAKTFTCLMHCQGFVHL